MNQPANLIVAEEDGISVVTFAQPTLLDAYHIGEVGKELEDLIDQQNHRRIVLDFSTIKMISSQALGVLLGLRQKLTEHDGRLVICGIDPRLYRVFKITKLQDVFDFFQDKASALNSFS